MSTKSILIWLLVIGAGVSVYLQRDRLGLTDGAAPVVSGSSAEADQEVTPYKVSTPDTPAPDGRRTTKLPTTGVVVERSPFVVTVRASGRAEAPNRVDLSARVTERIRKVNVTEGDLVDKGDVLIELDTRPFQLALEEARAREATAKADYDVRTLDSDDNASRHALAAHRSGLTEARLAVERAKLDLQSTKITAPFTGRVAALDAVPGQLAPANTELVTLVDASRLRIPAEVLERDFGRVAVGAAASVRLAAYPDDEIAGTVTAVSPECDPETGTGRAYIEIENADEHVRPGMYAEVELEIGSLDERLAVPRAAVLERDRKLLVFKAVNGRAEWQYVEVGVENEDLVEVTHGLAPGDTVLVDGHFTLAHGAPVKVSVKDS